MKVDANMKLEINLTLTEDEAKWLREFVQNPICEDESEEDEDNRHRLFDSLGQVLNAHRLF